MKNQEDGPVAATAGPMKQCLPIHSSYHNKPEPSSDPDDKVARLKANILDCVGKRGRHTSFAELSQHVEGFNGEYQYNMKYSNVVVWADMSKEAVEAILQLNRKACIRLSPASVWVYYHDGISLKLPIAKRLMDYKKPHWLPTTLTKVPQAEKVSR